ncbi:MAG TPA: tetratricopeptide repeat protein [Pyrinomonadaceae bacterium]|nr:tetratricopeptide repeat protein [Pyrinomonadaceae bacterium]
MSEHFISRQDAEKDLLSCAAYLGERINSIDGHAEAMIAVVPQYLAQGNVDLAAELSNTIDDPFTRDRLLIAVAETCAAKDDDEYAFQLADAVEDPGLRIQAFESIGLQKAAKGQFDKAREVASSMPHPDGVLVGVAVRQAADGFEDDAMKTIDEIEHAGAAITALIEIAMRKLQSDDAEKAITFLEQAVEESDDIEHREEQARARCDIGNAFVEAGRNDKAIETFDKARETAETIDNIHRDAFLSLTAQGFLHAGSLDLADRTLDLVKDKTHMASALLGYSREFWKQDKKDDALESLEEAFAILESQHERETRDQKSRFRLLTTIAAQFAGFERGERAIQVAEGIKDEQQRTAALSQVASILALRKEDEQASQAYRAITEDSDRVFALIGMSDSKEKNEDQAGATELLSEASHLSETVPQLTMRATAYVEIGKRYLSFGEAEKAREAFSASVDTTAQIRDESARVTTLVSLVEATAGSDIDLSDFPGRLLQQGARSA